MKLEVGQFVRFKDKRNITYIRKIREIPQDNRYASIYLDKEANYSKGLSLKNIIKASYNIIDILEVGDYVNGMEVTRISGTRYDKNDLHCYCEHNGNENWQQVMIPVKNIKSIVTKEQFEEMSYKIED